MRLYVLVLLSLLMLSVSFADSPPPPPSQVTVHLVSNGANETSIGQIAYHCTAYATPENETILPCSAGTCTNQPAYGSDCSYFPEGYFSYEYRGQNKSSEMFNATQFDQYYEYQLDVQTGKITLINAYNKPGPGICGTAFALLLAGLFIRGRN